MSLPAPPSQHQLGDLTHLADHNAISAALASLESAVTALQGQAAVPVLQSAGGNAVTLPGTGTGMLTVTVSAVNRDGGADLLDFYYGTQKIFSLNSYGELRLTAASLSHVAQVIAVLASQSADAWQVVSPGSAVLARVGPDGSASFAGPVSRQLPGGPAGWVHCTLLHGWATYQGRTLTVKLTNDNMVQISGQMVPGTVNDGTTIATVPPGYAPVSRAEPVMYGQANCSPDKIGGFFQVNTDGTIMIFSFGDWRDIGNGHIVLAGRYTLDAN